MFFGKYKHHCIVNLWLPRPLQPQNAPGRGEGGQVVTLFMRMTTTQPLPSLSDHGFVRLRQDRLRRDTRFLCGLNHQPLSRPLQPRNAPGRGEGRKVVSLFMRMTTTWPIIVRTRIRHTETEPVEERWTEPLWPEPPAPIEGQDQAAPQCSTVCHEVA
jgi:hypothetical protein